MKASGPSSLRGIELSCLRLQIPADIGRMTGRGLVYAAPPRAACDPQEPFVARANEWLLPDVQQPTGAVPVTRRDRYHTDEPLRAHERRWSSFSLRFLSVPVSHVKLM